MGWTSRPEIRGNPESVKRQRLLTEEVARKGCFPRRCDTTTDDIEGPVYLECQASYSSLVDGAAVVVRFAK